MNGSNATILPCSFAAPRIALTVSSGLLSAACAVTSQKQQTNRQQREKALTLRPKIGIGCI
jgi:hypothetical protein